ncbi:acyltransferase ChoActase/COT/CPT [Phycomyces blakesleeanus]
MVGAPLLSVSRRAFNSSGRLNVKNSLSSNYSTATKTFGNQSILPRLPIPELDATAARYKRSLLPLLSAAEHAQVSQKIDRFVKKDGLGQTLQARMHALDEQEAKLGLSWLDRLWLNRGYLEYRIPTVLNVNWWSQFRDHPDGLISQVPEGTITDFQISRSAGLVSGLLDYSNKINDEAIPPEASRSGPFCMHQIRHMFGTSRIAANPRDTIVTSCPATAKHITVIYKDQIFAVPVLGPNGETVPLKTLENQLRQVVSRVDQLPKEQLQPPVGLMTSEHRDTWGEVRKELETIPTNASTFSAIDSSLFTLCLDNYSSPDDKDLSHRNLAHGKGAHNRWFDKALQIIVESNGRAGINGEHSPCDAVVPQRTVESVLMQEPIVDNLATSNISQLPAPTHLQWSISSKTDQQLKAAQENVDKLIADYDSVLLHYDAYGSDFMKKAKVSPDGWLQMAYQLAYYRQYGKPCPTYESASTRKFLTGRTETVRSCSVESVAFTKAWDNKDIQMNDKLALFGNAIASQSEYMKASSNGHGVDRHLLGLRCQMTPEEAASEEAAIFQDPSYWGSQYWLLSTSNTSPGDLSWGGFGAVVPEGYGANYAIAKQGVKMSISAWNSCADTDATSFRKTVRGVLDEFGQVAEDYLVQK